MKLNKDYKTTKYFPSLLNTCEYVILHHTGKGRGIDIVKYLAHSETQVSCHFVVDTDWTVYQLADPRKCTRHAGKSEYKGKTNLNLYSIGIEVVSDGHTFTDPQREAVRELVKSLMKEYAITSDRVIRHKDIAPWRKRDIGDNFRNDQYSSFEEYQKSLDLKEPDLTPEALEMMKIWIRNWTRAKDPATREEVATMIFRMMKFLTEG